MTAVVDCISFALSSLMTRTVPPMVAAVTDTPLGWSRFNVLFSLTLVAVAAALVARTLATFGSLVMRNAVAMGVPSALKAATFPTGIKSFFSLHTVVFRTVFGFTVSMVSENRNVRKEINFNKDRKWILGKQRKSNIDDVTHAPTFKEIRQFSRFHYFRQLEDILRIKDSNFIF